MTDSVLFSLKSKDMVRGSNQLWPGIVEGLNKSRKWVIAAKEHLGTNSKKSN